MRRRRYADPDQYDAWAEYDVARVHQRADKLPYEKSIFVDELIKYLETDLLFYRVSGPRNLSVSQSEKWDKLIYIFDNIFQTSWNVSTNIMPLKQDPESIQKIKDYLITRRRF